jgi:hypothetical protein
MDRGEALQLLATGGAALHLAPHSLLVTLRETLVAMSTAMRTLDPEQNAT